MSFTIRPVDSNLLSVAQYASRLGSAVRQVGGADLEGEVQRVQRRANGMLWFSLTDGEATLSCKVFTRDAARLEHQPRDGDLVRVRVDRPDFYAAQGSLSLIVSAISLAGEGELLRRRAALLEQLRREGLCDPARRRPLPRFPRAVGVIAGANSDGMSDVVRALTDRWPAVHVVTTSSAVQGKSAPAQLIDALARLQAHPLIDTIVMARGGGSVQDLACFDDERLCRALFACELPVVCAIGHTDNVPVCNHVAWAAYTPSRSAEMVVPSAVELGGQIAHAGELLDATPSRIAGLARHLEAVAAQVDCAHAIELHTVQIAQQGRQLIQGARGSLDGVAVAIQGTHATLATTPLRAGRRLAAQRETLSAAVRVLGDSAERISELTRRVGEARTRIVEGIRRQLADHTRDYGRASERLMREARAGLERRELRLREQLIREGTQIAHTTGGRLDDARRRLAHQADVVAARDFRPRGWLLASHAGEPIRSVADLAPGDSVELSLHDGRAGAVINDIHESEDPGV